jgi:hypothetical protein
LDETKTKNLKKTNLKKSHIEEIEISFEFLRNEKKTTNSERQNHYAIMNLKLIKNKLYRELVLCANLFNV